MKLYEERRIGCCSAYGRIVATKDDGSLLMWLHINDDCQEHPVEECSLLPLGNEIDSSDFEFWLLDARPEIWRVYQWYDACGHPISVDQAVALYLS